MKLISLNVWGGKLYQPLINFIKQHSKDTDVFCFQEVFHTTSGINEQLGFRINLYEEISKILNTHQGYFAPTLDNYIVGGFQPNFINFNLSSGLAIFINQNIKVASHKDVFVFGHRNSFNLKDLNGLPRNIQFINIILENKKFSIFNMHGIWVKGTKDDTSSRISQSKQIVELLDKEDCEKILCGDFNLNPDTQSVKILETKMINLIKKYNIPTTRNKFFPGEEKFADYTFVSNGINVKNFQVPNIELSDHLPMILEFS